MSEDRIYTKEELDEMPRGQLRRLSVKKYGMNNRDCVDLSAAEIKKFIMEKQGNDEGAEPPTEPNPDEGTAGKKKTTRRKPAAKKEPAKKAAPRKKASPKKDGEDVHANVAAEMFGLIESCNNDVLAMSEGVSKDMEGLKTDMEALRGDMDVLLRNQAIQAGLMMDLWKDYYGEDDLEPRLNELSEEYEEAQGNAGGEGN
jgi:hypothetical protein